MATIATMPSRLFVFVLALALLWSGFSTFEATNVLTPASLEQLDDRTDAGARVQTHQGSVEDHHLDDQPHQAQSDPPTDTPELPPALHKLSANSSARSLLQPYLSAAAGPPMLAGLLRPPSSATLAG